MRRLHSHGKLSLRRCLSYWTDEHQKAVALGLKNYVDPKTGYTVFTEIEHLDRGYCCGSKCRHCPYNHVNCSTESPKQEEK